VAVVWYECLTGRAPFDGDSPEEVLRAVCEAPIDFYSLPDKYVALLRPALHRLPGFRMASISDLKARIQQMGFARATVAPAPAWLSSVPAPKPAPPAEDRRAKPTIAGLGPEQLFAPSPLPMRVDSEVIRLPTKTNRGVWLAGVGLAVAVALSAWWTVRDLGGVPNAPWEAAIAQPAPPTEDEQPERESEVPSIEETAETRADSRSELVAALQEPGAAPPAAQEIQEVAQAPEQEPQAPVPELAAEIPVPDETEVAPQKPLRAKAPRARSKTRTSQDSQYQPLPDLVTEW
jgi:hypothetical protein